MNVVLWILQGLLAAAFLVAGLTKVSRPKEKLRDQMAWVDDFSPGVVKMIGSLEILGAIGLILPWATGIAPVLTPIAALGFVALMIGATITHIRRHEMKFAPVPAVLGILALIIAIGRF